jgi:hypothetical protein
VTQMLAKPQLWWRAAIVLGGVAGLLFGNPALAKFTCQSNLLALGYFSASVSLMLRRRTTEPAAPRLRGPVTFSLMITCLVSYFLLDNMASPFPGLSDPDAYIALGNRGTFLLHYVVPIMVLIDWLAFGPHRVSRWRDLPLWLLIPVGYALMSIARAVIAPTVPDRYPYFFLDPTSHGYGWVVLQMLQLAVEFAVLAAIVMGLDRAVAAITSRRPLPADERVRYDHVHEPAPDTRQPSRPAGQGAAES